MLRSPNSASILDESCSSYNDRQDVERGALTSSSSSSSTSSPSPTSLRTTMVKAWAINPGRSHQQQHSATRVMKREQEGQEKENIRRHLPPPSSSSCHSRLLPDSPVSRRRWTTTPVSTTRRHSFIGHWSLALISICFILDVFVTKAHAQVTSRFECRPTGCCDQHEWCAFWATIGECESNKIWMTPNCQLACNTCSSAGNKIFALHTRPSRPAIKRTTSQPPTTTSLPPTTTISEEEPSPEVTTSTLEVTTTTEPITTSTAEPTSVPTTSSPTPPVVITTSSALPPGSPQPPASGSAPGVKQDLRPVTFGPVVIPTGPKLALGNNPARCEEIRKGNLSNSILIMRHDGLVNEKEDISFRRTFSITDIFSSNSQFGCAPQQDFTDCSKNICFNLRFRTADGTCNNFQNPLFGAAATPFIRLKPPAYDDGVAAPTATIRGGRPSSRDVSRFLLSSPQLVLNDRFNALVMQFGQFATHDITKTSLLPTDKCIGCTEIPGRCSPIKADPADPRFGCSSPPCCLSFTRSAPVCGTGTNSPRAQLNENTAFMDGSMIYGSSVSDANRLREGALLKSTQFNGHNFLPFNQQQCSGPTNCNANFDAGDNRITIFVGLAAFHTIFLREHNRMASILQKMNTHWTADRTYQETRKIVGAILQAITYKEWLPKILGSALASSVGPYKGYDEKLNPSIASEFTHAAMRFGHGMIQESYNRLDINGQPIAQGGMKFDEGVLKPQKLLFEGGVDPIVRGMLNMPLKKPQRVTTIVTEKMFGSSDLAAINLQRGRDVGLPPYNDWREFCGLKRAQTFDDLSGEILDKNVRTNLQTGFKTTDTIDLYVGALVEDPVVDGLVGPTLACLIGDQFKRVRDGDRFWYQNPATFTPDQLAEIEKVTFARIICDDTDDFKSVPPNAFEVPTGSNAAVPCTSIPALDLSKWSD